MSKNPLKSLVNGHRIERMAHFFRALGEASRLHILQSLNSSEKSVGEITRATKLNQPNVSRHLSVMLAAGVIKKRKVGLHVLYSVADESVFEVLTPAVKRTAHVRNDDHRS